MKRARGYNHLAVLVGALSLLSMFGAHAVQAQGIFTTASLQGTYAYVNSTSDVASFGLITFNGTGNMTLAIKINRPDDKGGRKVITTTATGTYTVEADGAGAATIKFKGSDREVIYDFVITQVGDGKGDRILATEVFSVLRTGGVKGQLVVPVWKRIAD